MIFSNFYAIFIDMKKHITSQKNPVDSDADGLTNDEEKIHGTDPLNPDSDNDGLGDNEEINVYGTDPLNPDTDNNGLTDGDEVKRGLNPRGPGLLKDLFIPHAGNNYQPHALHPKRIAFHAAAAILMKLIIVIVVFLIPVEAWLTPDILTEQAKEIIKLTNQIRSRLNLGLLAENSLLNQAAAAKTEDMLIKQYFSHSGPDNRSLANWLKDSGYNYKFAGENLALGFASAAEVVNGWSRSKTHYNNIIDPQFSEIGVGLAAGLYHDYDTTFVAQLFGAPPAPALAISPTAATAPKISARPKYFTAKIAETTAYPAADILSKKITEPLLEPTIIEPADQLLTKDNLIKLKIFAPQAQKIIIYDNEIALAEITDIINNYALANLTLPQGRHSLKAKASRASEEKYSLSCRIIIDRTAPLIDQSKTNLTIDQPVGQDQQIVKAEAYLSADTAKAEINFNNYFIKLRPDENNSNKWIGQTIIFKQAEEQIFNPVVLANLTAEDRAGNITTEDITWKDITLVKTSLLNQYFFIKGHQPQYLKPLFDITSIYYKIILAIAILALALNIFIEIKKQQPHLIASAVGLIGLLVFLLIL